MVKDIKTAIVIEATPETIWTILTRVDDYPTWNPFIKSIKGTLKKGEKITVRIEPPDAKGMTFKPTILALETNKVFRWLGHFLFPGLFDGEHQFELIDNGNNTTTLIHSEKFSGILVPLLQKLLNDNTKRGFEAMNLKLKELSESK
jgi:hypothetical protein